jgi:glycerophosphoryl diester phosphodiesterase
MDVFFKRVQMEILDGDFDQYTEDMVKDATQTGHLVLPDIQRPGENAALWEQAIQKGIRGLQTDHPADLIGYLVMKQLR